MTTMTDPPKASFQLSMLIYDTRYRSYTFQFIALALLIALMAFLGVNLVKNLAEQGQNISYSFLGEPAGYDINQRPIEYDSQSSHMRAALVGMINTLIVAFLGCITATIFGVTAGILRLSPNWLVRRLHARRRKPVRRARRPTHRSPGRSPGQAAARPARGARCAPCSGLRILTLTALARSQMKGTPCTVLARIPPRS